MAAKIPARVALTPSSLASSAILVVATPSGANKTYIKKRKFSGSTHTPIGAQQFRLLEDRPHGFVLQIGGIAVLVQDAFYHHADFRSGTFPESPVDGHALPNLGDEFGGDHLELVVAHARLW